MRRHQQWWEWWWGSVCVNWYDLLHKLARHQSLQRCYAELLVRLSCWGTEEKPGEGSKILRHSHCRKKLILFPEHSLWHQSRLGIILSTVSVIGNIHWVFVMCQTLSSLHLLSHLIITTTCWDGFNGYSLAWGNQGPEWFMNFP